MKVNIGPYNHWFGPYQLAQKILFWIPEERDDHGFPCTAARVHRFGEWLAHGSIAPEPKVGDISPWGAARPTTLLYKLLVWIESRKQRKVKVRIDRWDTWSMDDTLAYIIHPMLLQLRKNKKGGPHVEDQDVPECLRSTAAPTKENDYDIDDNHFKRWDWVLDEMIFAFTSKMDDFLEEQFTTGNQDIQSVLQADGNWLMVKGPNHTAETDWDGYKAYNTRIQNGFRLFGTYFQNLWT